MIFLLKKLTIFRIIHRRTPHSITLLNHAVLQGMKGDYRQSSARVQNRNRLVKQLRQAVKFAVDCNAYRLKGPGGRMLLFVPRRRWHGRTNHFGEIARCFKQTLLTSPDNRSGQAAAVAFFPIIGKNPSQDDRSEERRVGKECRSRWSPYH